MLKSSIQKDGPGSGLAIIEWFWGPIFILDLVYFHESFFLAPGSFPESEEISTPPLC
jgi:hypothetical protein